MAYFLDTVIPDNALFLFFSKAEQFGLFGTMTPVKGYVNKKTGKLVSPYTGLRRRALKKPDHPLSGNLFGHAGDEVASSHIQPEPVKVKKPRKLSPEKLDAFKAKIAHITAHAKVDAQHAPKQGEVYKKLYLAKLESIKGIPADLLDEAKQNIEGLFKPKTLTAEPLKGQSTGGDGGNGNGGGKGNGGSGGNGSGDGEPPNRRIYHDGQLLPLTDVLAYYDQEIAGKPAGAIVPNPSFAIGMVDHDTAKNIGLFLGQEGKRRMLRVSGRVLKHIFEQRPDLSRHITENLKSFFLDSPEIYPNHQYPWKKVLIVHPGDKISSAKNYVAAAEIEINGERLDIVSIMSMPDRTLRKAKELKARWLEGQQPPKPVGDSPHHLAFKDAHPEADLSGAQPALSVTLPPTAPEGKAAQAKPKSDTRDPDAEFLQTERAYGGRAAYKRALDAGKTKLNYRQWVQVRTPAFKQWFGDWEIASAQPRRAAATFAEARKQAGAFQGMPLTNAATGIVATVSRNNLDKMLSGKAVGKSESPATHSLAVANLDGLFERAILGWSKPDNNGDPNIKAIHRFFTPVKVDGRALLAKMTVKETIQDSKANPLYTVEAVSFEEIKNPAAQWVGEIADADGIDPRTIRSAGLVQSMAQRIQDFNPDSVSKAVDDTGEPLIMYRMSSRSPDHPQNNQKTYWSSSPAVANSYMRGKDAIHLGMQGIPVFVRATRVLDAGGMRTDQRGGHGAIWIAEDRVSASPAEGPVMVRNIKDADWRGVERSKRGHARFAGHVAVTFGAQGIKSALGNRGRFDAKDPDITKAWPFPKGARFLFYRAVS